MKPKPCPECKREPKVEALKGAFKGQWSVTCDPFYCDHESTPEPSQHEAIRKWNERKRRKVPLIARLAKAARERYLAMPVSDPFKQDALDEWRKLRLRSLRNPR